ncbi:EamA family transporter [Dongshaea marina]|uniref:EamA family transporter n=1 Tax=Dongshaea marina TaxID=2047966 RepID=UPI000D3E6611|nr:EamA family transporter [Dongshaea marina]
MIPLLLGLTLLLTCSGQLLQKMAASGQNRWLSLIGAIGCLGLGALCWLAVLQKLPVGIAYPMLSLNYVLVMLASHWIFKETVSFRQWLGVILVVAGVVILGGHL